MQQKTRKKRVVAVHNGTEDRFKGAQGRAARNAAVKRPSRRGHAGENPNASTSKKRMTGVDDFRRRIQKQGDDLIKFIDEQATAISDVVDQTITIDELATSLVLALPWLASPTVSSQASSSYSLQLDEKAVDELYNTIECYEKLNARSTQLQKPNWMRWERDGKELTELNEHAMGFAAQNVSFTVMPGLLGSLTRPPAEVCDIQKMAWELIDGGRPRKGEETWGMVAQGQAKAFTTLLKTLPLEK